MTDVIEVLKLELMLFQGTEYEPGLERALEIVQRFNTND